MNTPSLYTALGIKNWNTATNIGPPGADCWVPARPFGLQGFNLKIRIKLAAGVFLGKFDALRWDYNTSSLTANPTCEKQAV